MASHVRRCANATIVKKHVTPLHHLLRAYRLNPNHIEKIETYPRNNKWTPKIITCIDKSRKEGIARDKEAAAEFDAIVYTDGSADSTGVGAAAVLVKNGQVTRTLSYHLGLPTEHTTFQAEAVGAILGAHLIDTEDGIVVRARIGLDNTPVIRAARRYRPKPWTLLPRRPAPRHHGAIDSKRHGRCGGMDARSRRHSRKRSS